MQNQCVRPATVTVQLYCLFCYLYSPSADCASSVLTTVGVEAVVETVVGAVVAADEVEVVAS